MREQYVTTLNLSSRQNCSPAAQKALGAHLGSEHPLPLYLQRLDDSLVALTVRVVWRLDYILPDAPMRM